MNTAHGQRLESNQFAGNRKMRTRAAREVVHQASIDSMSHDGRGIARLDGKVVFVDGALPGEEVTFRVNRWRRGHGEGVLHKVLAFSPDRIDAPCPHFGRCGGCALQHLSNTAQVARKQQILLDALQRLGKTTPDEVLEPLTGPSWHYRRKARLGIRFVPKKGGVLLGFRERRKSYITPLSECRTLDKRCAARLLAIHEVTDGLSCRERLPQVEFAAGDDTEAFVFRHLTPLSESDRECLAGFARTHETQVFVQPGGIDSVQPLYPSSPEPLSYVVADPGVRLQFLPTDFVQVNGAVNRLLVDAALALLDPAPGDRILDLFCGIGNFTLPLAARASSVVGLEGNIDLVARARGNAERNSLQSATFECVDLHDSGQVDALQHPCTTLLLDPPRSGAVEIVKRYIPRAKPARVLYVSCNPATLARDSEILTAQHGYRLRAVGVVDMFPHTTHCEAIALYEPR